MRAAAVTELISWPPYLRHSSHLERRCTDKSTVWYAAIAMLKKRDGPVSCLHCVFTAEEPMPTSIPFLTMSRAIRMQVLRTLCS